MAATSRDNPHFPETRSQEATLASLKVVEININSIVRKQRRFDLLYFLELVKPDVALLCETKTNSTHKLTLEGYHIVRNDRGTKSKGGGTAILIRDSIPFEAVYSSRNNEIIEYSIVKIKRAGKTLFLVSLYANNEERRTFIVELEHLFARLELQNPDNFYTIAGDFNSLQINITNHGED